jgi:hypothetical protein
VSIEKTNHIKLQELKFAIGKLLVEWRFNGNELKPRTGKIYRALADELERTLKDFERKEQGLHYVEVE